MLEKNGLRIVQQNPLTFCAAALLGFGVNFSGFLVIKLLGGLSMKVISTFRNIAIVIVSASIFGDVVTVVEALGYGISTVGIVLFNFAKLNPQANDLGDLAAVGKLVWGFAFNGKHPCEPDGQAEYAAVSILPEEARALAGGGV